MNNKKTLFKNYEEFYEKVSVIDQQIYGDREDIFASLISSDKKLDIVDFGCGEGTLPVLLALKGHRVTAADISQGFLDRAKKLAEKNSVQISIVKCDITADISMFKDKKFDVVFFMDIIEHLKNATSAIENIRCLLKDEGVLFIHTPNACAFRNFIKYLIKRRELSNFYNPKNLGDLHFGAYDYISIEKLLNFIGLKVQEMIPMKLTLPGLSRFSGLDSVFKFLARHFPLLSDNLLFKCKKSAPIDIDKQIAFWEKLSKQEK